MISNNSTYKQPVNSYNQFTGSGTEKVFSMIDNYIYLYHTNTLIALPTYPETINDQMSATFSPTTPLARSAPIYSYSNSGPRTFNISLMLHRDMMKQINTSVSSLDISELANGDDYVDLLIKQIQAAVVPVYGSAEKMVNPPIVAVRFGNDIFCKGVINGSLTTSYSGPILKTNKYALVQLDFPISEIDPYDAYGVQAAGHFRGFSTDLGSRRIYKSTTSKTNGGVGGGAGGARLNTVAIS